MDEHQINLTKDSLEEAQPAGGDEALTNAESLPTGELLALAAARLRAEGDAGADIIESLIKERIAPTMGALTLYDEAEVAADRTIEREIIAKERRQKLTEHLSEILSPFDTLFLDRIPAPRGVGSQLVHSRIFHPADKSHEWTLDKPHGSQSLAYKFKMTYTEKWGDYLPIEEVEEVVSIPGYSSLKLGVKYDKGQVVSMGIKSNMSIFATSNAVFDRIVPRALYDFLKYTTYKEPEGLKVDLKWDTLTGDIVIKAIGGEARYTLDEYANQERFKKMSQEGGFVSGPEYVDTETMLKVYAGILQLIPTYKPPVSP